MEPQDTWDSAGPNDKAEPRRFFAETGHAVRGPFLGFVEHYGLSLCGFPISDELVENGVRCQYFQNVALELIATGAVRLKPLGEAWMAQAHERGRADRAASGARVHEVDVVSSLARHPSRSYASRQLADIRYLVIHHTGAGKDLSVRDIAQEHVGANGWPGIGYHFVIDADGTVYRTQDLTTVSHHARQFNPVSVGIALVGDLGHTLPTVAQGQSASELLADLLIALGLPISAIRGHREMVPTPCPGDTFLSVWKPRLVQGVERLLRGESLEEPAIETRVMPPVAPASYDDYDHETNDSDVALSASNESSDVDTINSGSDASDTVDVTVESTGAHEAEDRDDTVDVTDESTGAHEAEDSDDTEQAAVTPAP